jgi:hypothetical protein
MNSLSWCAICIVLTHNCRLGAGGLIHALEHSVECLRTQAEPIRSRFNPMKPQDDTGVHENPKKQIQVGSALVSDSKFIEEIHNIAKELSEEKGTSIYGGDILQKTILVASHQLVFYSMSKCDHSIRRQVNMHANGCASYANA